HCCAWPGGGCVLGWPRWPPAAPPDPARGRRTAAAVPAPSGGEGAARPLARLLLARHRRHRCPTAPPAFLAASDTALLDATAISLSQPMMDHESHHQSRRRSPPARRPGPARCTRWAERLRPCFCLPQQTATCPDPIGWRLAVLYYPQRPPIAG